MTADQALLWRSSAWRKQAEDWIRAETSRNGIHVDGPIEQPHLYPWSTVLRIPSSAGVLFFKATAPETRYEAALTETLARWQPDCTPELVSVDRGLGWMLMHDGGQQLRSFIRPTRDPTAWGPVIERFAELQIGMVDHVTELLDMGVPDWRLSRLPNLYSEFLEDGQILCVDEPKGVTAEDLGRLRSLQQRFTSICSELASLGIPETMNHGDLTDGNVLMRDGRVTIFDWGDGSITHPFVSLRTFFVSIEISMKLELEDWSLTQEMSTLLDRYLKVWEAVRPAETLRAAYPLSRCAASVVKALSWRQTVSPLQGALRQEYAWIVPEVLREFLILEKMLAG